MKTCPICKARCFDDMEICYGCMHPFEPEDDVGDKNAFEGDLVVQHMRDPDECPGVGFAKHMHEDSEKAQPLCRGPEPLPGIADEGESPRFEERVRAGCDAGLGSECTAGGLPEFMPMLEPVEGPLAMASLGNGYRLVLAIERE